MNPLVYIPNRQHMARFFYGMAIFFLFHRACNHMLLSQLQQPVLTYTSTDITYILLKWLGISPLLVQNVVAATIFDILLIGTAIAAFIMPRRNVPAIMFTILLGIYIVTGYSYLCFHKHNLDGLWWGSLMFWAVRQKTFNLLFDLTRCYAIFTYFSAGFWKFYREVWNTKGHLAVILKADATPYMAEHVGTLKAQVISWLVIHPHLLDTIMMVTCIVQLSYFIGFITSRADWVFFLFAVSFHIMSLVLLRAYFIEFTPILITLLPLQMLYKKID